MLSKKLLSLLPPLGDGGYLNAFIPVTSIPVINK